MARSIIQSIHHSIIQSIVSSRSIKSGRCDPPALPFRLTIRPGDSERATSSRCSSPRLTQAHTPAGPPRACIRRDQEKGKGKEKDAGSPASRDSAPPPPPLRPCPGCPTHRRPPVCARPAATAPATCTASTSRPRCLSCRWMDTSGLPPRVYWLKMGLRLAFPPTLPWASRAGSA